ncbi:hypothetical protein BLOT_001105 [Blomia tropicalis]|nr:hypothetical protein BLOT_001105 [Blomia tropicalis]
MLIRLRSFARRTVLPMTMKTTTNVHIDADVCSLAVTGTGAGGLFLERIGRKMTQSRWLGDRGDVDAVCESLI